MSQHAAIEIPVGRERSARQLTRKGIAGETVRSGSGRMPRAVRMRRGWPIKAYVGPNGHGKSLCAVLDTMPSLERGRKVLSTVRLLDWRAVEGSSSATDWAGPDWDLYYPDSRTNGGTGAWFSRDSDRRWQRPEHPGYIRLTEFRQLLEADDCDVLLDDVAGVASSRQSSGMPAAIEALLQKLRHSDMVLRWTAPSWARADIIIREVTQAVTVAEGSRPEKTEHEGRLWKRNRMFLWNTYDAASYTDWTESATDKARRLCRQRFYLPGQSVANAYDSLGAIDRISSVTDAGRCVHCGGNRRAPACVCADYTARVAVGQSRQPARKRSADGLPGLTDNTGDVAEHQHSGCDHD